MSPVVSVIYVNYNTTGLLLQSIASVLSQCRKVSYEIIIVDNASLNEEKLQLQSGIQELSHGMIQVIFSDSNSGFSRANNQGAKEAKGKYLFFLNPDTIVLNDVISLFYRFMESSDPRTAACGGNLLKEDHSPNYSYGNFPGLLYEICTIGFGLRFLFNRYYKEKVFIGRTVEGTDIKKAPYITGADIFIRADLFKSMDGFDERFFMYYEETDLFMRLAKKGYESYILPEAKIIHFEGGAVGKSSPQKFNYNKFEMTLRSKMYYFAKWRSPFITSVLKVVVFLQIMVQYLKGNQGSDIKRSLSIYRKNI